ncbi:MAG: NAD(P)-dependent oxidoreductase, partial [Chitinophagaceae bacterium]
DETHHMADADFFNLLERRPFFLNSARGGLVSLEELVNALKENKIMGAGLDVLENENFETYSATENIMRRWLLEQPNVIVTPQIAGYSHESFYKMAKVLLQKLGLE